MNRRDEPSRQASGFRVESTARVAMTALVLLASVAVASFFLDRLLLGAGALAVGVLLGIGAVLVRVADIRRRRRDARAALDPLTGVANRLRLRAILEEAVERSRRTEAQMTLVALDLDRFASINDTLGREAGDTVLRGVGSLLRESVRPVDHVFRTGDDEFLVLLDSLDVLNGRDLAEQIRAAIAGRPLVPDRSVTVSVGVAGLQPREDGTAWMRRAGARLRDAKAHGRNQVVA